MKYKLRPLSIISVEDEYCVEGKHDSIYTNYSLEVQFNEKDDRYVTLNNKIESLSSEKSSGDVSYYITLDVRENKLTRERDNYELKLKVFNEEKMSISEVLDEEKAEIENFIDNSAYEVIIKRDRNIKISTAEANVACVIENINNLRRTFSEDIRLNTINLTDVQIKYKLNDAIDSRGNTLFSVSILPKDYWASLINNDTKRYEDSLVFFLSLIPGIRVTKSNLQSLLASSTFHIYFDKSIYLSEDSLEKAKHNIMSIVFFLKNSLNSKVAV